MNPVAYFAKDYEDWKKGFLEIQSKADIILIDSDAGLYKEHESDMRAFVEANTKKPRQGHVTTLWPITRC
jgi:MinD-like ATPase involved in chromosome partitioning or flagellar assembly